MFPSNLPPQQIKGFVKFPSKVCPPKLYDRGWFQMFSNTPYKVFFKWAETTNCVVLVFPNIPTLTPNSFVLKLPVDVNQLSCDLQESRSHNQYQRPMDQSGMGRDKKRIFFGECKEGMGNGGSSDTLTHYTVHIIYCFYTTVHLDVCVYLYFFCNSPKFSQGHSTRL